MDYEESMAVIGEQWSSMVRWLDSNLLKGVYAAVSVDTEQERRRFRQANWVFVDPQASSHATWQQVGTTADQVILQAGQGAALRGGAAGLVGAASIPPEVMATLATLVRLAQRLAVVYGFDPESDKGHMVVWQALASALDVDLPADGPMGLKVRDLRAVVSMPEPDQVGAAMTRALVRKSVWMVIGKLTRFVPVLSAGSAAVGGRRRVQEAGRKMKEVYQRLGEASPVDRRRVVEAEEIVAS